MTEPAEEVTEPAEEVTEPGGEETERTGGVTGRADAGQPPGRGAEPLTVPESVPAIGAELSGLSEAHTAEERAFLLDGGALWIAGTESRRGFRVGEGNRVLATVQLEGFGAVANVLLFPGVARRQSVGVRGTVLETLVSSPRLPLVVAQWAQAGAGNDRAGSDGSPDASGTTPEEIVVEIAPPGVETTLGRHRDHVTVEARGRVTAVALSPAPATLHARTRSDGGARVVFTPSTDGPSSLLVTAGGRDRVRTSIQAGVHARAHATQAAAGPHEGLALRSGVPEIDDGLLWLRSRLAGQARRATSPDPALGLAAIGVGDREAGERLLALGETSSPDRALLAARFASVLGDTGPAARIADHWGRHGPPEGHPLIGLAARSLAEALDHVSHPGLIAELRAMGATRHPPARGERRLPTVGDAGATLVDDERWWQSLLSGDPAPPVASHGRRAVVEAREACARFVTDPDAAWTTWRHLVSSAPEGGRATTTLWDPLPDSDPGATNPGAPSLAAELLLAVIHGLLGIRADAAVGRLRLAPRLPSHVRSFGVRGIPVGTSSLGMEYRRDDGVHTFELLPERAAVPPLLIFEPSVPGVAEKMRVDGEPAELEAVTAEGRTMVPVQLPVDRPRTIEIRT